MPDGQVESDDEHRCPDERHSADTQAELRQAIARHGHLPPPDPAVLGLNGDDRAWVTRRQTAQPASVYDHPLTFDPLRVMRWPRSFIDCTSPARATIALMRERVRSEPGWNVIEIPTGHDAMISAPRRVAGGDDLTPP